MGITSINLQCGRNVCLVLTALVAPSLAACADIDTSIVVGENRQLVLRVLGERYSFLSGDELLVRWDEQSRQLHVNGHRVHWTDAEVPRSRNWELIRDRFGDVPLIRARRAALAADLPDSAAWVDALDEWDLAKRELYAHAWDAYTEARERGEAHEAGLRAVVVFRASELVESAELVSRADETQQSVDVTWKGRKHGDEHLLHPDSRPVVNRPTEDSGFGPVEYETVLKLFEYLSFPKERKTPLLIEFGSGTIQYLSGKSAVRHELYGVSASGGER